MKEYLDRLVEVRQRAWNEAKEILDAAQTEQREMTVDERTKWENINADLDAKDAEIRSILEREEANKASDEARERVAHLIVPGRKDETPAEPNIRDLFAGGSRALDFAVDAETARWLSERRDITTVAGSAGKTIPPSTMVGRLYEELVKNTNIFGVSTIVTTASGEPMDFPVIKAASDSANAKIAASSQPVSEAAAIPEVDPVFDKVTITPAKYGVLLQVSSELAQDTVVDLAGYIARASAQGIRNKAGAALTTTMLAGATTSGVAYSNFAATATNTSGVGYTNLVDIAYAVNPEYRESGSWFANDAFYKNTRKLLDSQNLPVWQPAAVAGEPDRLLGFPVVQDPNMPISGAGAKVVVFGDLSAHTIRQVGNVRFEVSSEYAFNTDLVTYRVIWRGGSAVLDTQALKAATITA